MLQFHLDIEFQQSGALKAIQTEAQLAFLQKELHELHSKGHNLQIVTTRDAQSIEYELGSDLVACMYYPLGGSANPVKTTLAFASEAQQNGARILTGHEVSSIEYLDNSIYKVVTPKSSFQAQTLVLAAGPWCRLIGTMLNLNIPVFPVRGQMWTTGPVPTHLFHALGASESSRLTRHLYGRQTRDGEIIFGGDRQLTNNKTPDKDGIDTKIFILSLV